MLEKYNEWDEEVLRDALIGRSVTSVQLGDLGSGYYGTGFWFTVKQSS